MSCGGARLRGHLPITAFQIGMVQTIRITLSPALRI
jgi:hypothetical protein